MTGSSTLTIDDVKKQLEPFFKEELRRGLDDLQAALLKELRELKEASRHGGSEGAARNPVAEPKPAPPPVPDNERAGVSAHSMGHDGEDDAKTALLARGDEQGDADASPVSGRGSVSQTDNGAAGSCNDTLSDFVKGNRFKAIVGFVVLLSVVWLAFVTHYNAIYWVDDPLPAFQAVEVFFAIVFSVEIALRIWVWGASAFFCATDWPAQDGDDQSTFMWGNLFDFGLVALQVSDLIAEGTGLADGSTGIAGFLRVLRLVRVVRLIRVFNVVPDLRVLLVSIIQSFRPLMWVFALVMIITAIFGVIITTIASEFKCQHKVDLEEKGVYHRYLEDLEENFGGLDRTILSLYGAISGGQDWRTSADPLMQLLGYHQVLWFVAYTFFVIFAMVNVINSQFVDSAIEASAKDRRENMVNNLMSTFAGAADQVDENLFMSYLTHPSMRTFLKDLYKREEVTPDEIRESRLFDMLDNDHGGTITRDELILGCVKLTGSATSLDLAVLKLDVQQIREGVTKMIETQFGPEEMHRIFPKQAKVTGGHVHIYK